MSILLDALRKSERRERLGAAPDIHADVSTPSPPSRPRWLAPALAALLLVVLIGGGYAFWRWSTPRVPVAPPELPMDTAQTSPAIGDADPAGPRPAVGEAERAPPAPATPAEPRRSPVESLSGERPYRAASAPGTTGSGPTPATDPVVDPSDRLATAVAHAGGSSFDATAAPPATAAAPAEAAPRRPEPQRSEPAVRERDDTGLVSYWQLPPGTRENLPDFRINVLVFDEDPDRRFIIMGGKRYQEGDQLKKSLRLLEIRRDRCIFRYGVYLFYVKQ